MLGVAMLSGCSTQPPTCTLNKVTIAPSSVVVQGARFRQASFDLSIVHLGGNSLRGPSLDVYDLGLKRDLGGPPVGANPAVMLPEGHRLKLSLKAILADGHALTCGAKTVTVPVSKGGMVPVPTETPSAQAA